MLGSHSFGSGEENNGGKNKLGSGVDDLTGGQDCDGLHTILIIISTRVY